MDVFKLSRNFFDWSFENPELISPTHSAIFFFAIEHCNRLWWKEKFWFPTSMVMEAIWIRKWETYNKSYQDLVKWWFIKEIEKSKNQYSSCIISISNATPKKGKALDKALVKHSRKHSESTGESKGVIDIQETNKQETRNNTTIVVIDESMFPEKIEYWDKDINKTLSYISKVVWCTTFKESQQMQRRYWKFMFDLGKKIGLDEFNYRLKNILEDPFKAKNSNKLAYLYWEIKSYIHSPVVEEKKKQIKVY